MSTDIVQPFDFKGYKVRTLTFETGQTWWVLKDVCDVLGLSNPSRVAQRLDGDEVSKFDPNSGLGSRSNEPVNIVNESGLYKIVLRSDKPEAKEFQRWVTHDVLPSIRRHGAYMSEAVVERTLTDPDYLIRLATQIKDERAARVAAERRVEAQRPKVEALDALTGTKHLYTLTETAQLLANSGPMGLNRLVRWMRGHKWVRRENQGLAPYQDKVDSGLLDTKAYRSRLDPESGDMRTFQPKIMVTPKGVARLHYLMFGTVKQDMGVAA